MTDKAVTCETVLATSFRFVEARRVPLPPVEGFPFPGFWTPVMEEKRQLVNRFVRRSGAYDAVIDFDEVLRDPDHPTRLRLEYDSGDHVHPNDLGHRAMAEAIDLNLFRGTDD